MTLTAEYIRSQDLTTLQDLLKQCLSNPKIYFSIIKHPELHPEIDELANTICYLEDQIRYLEQVANIEKANSARWANSD